MAFIHQVEPYLTGAEKAGLDEYLDNGGWLTEFHKTREFEAAIAALAGVPHCSIVTSGTVALFLACKAAGFGPGDKVVVPNYTMIATPNAVTWAGATPLLADIDPGTLCLDLASVPDDPAIKGVIHVSINGRSGDMAAMRRWCDERTVVLIEDACQALGSTWADRALGSFGHMGCYSFTPHKIITTGQGGAVVSADEDLAVAVAKLKDFHRTAPATDTHDGIGYNFKFTDLQAVVGLAQLAAMDYRLKRKRTLFATYKDQLAHIPEVTMPATDLTQVAPWFMDILLPDTATRDGLRDHLLAAGIGSRVFYPPINHQPMYSAAHPEGSLPVSEDLAVRGLWLPSSIGLSDADLERVCTAVARYFGG